MGPVLSFVAQLASVLTGTLASYFGLHSLGAMVKLSWFDL